MNHVNPRLTARLSVESRHSRFVAMRLVAVDCCAVLLLQLIFAVWTRTCPKNLIVRKVPVVYDRESIVSECSSSSETARRDGAHRSVRIASPGDEGINECYCMMS